MPIDKGRLHVGFEGRLHIDKGRLHVDEGRLYVGFEGRLRVTRGLDL